MWLTYFKLHCLLPIDMENKIMLNEVQDERLLQRHSINKAEENKGT